VVPRNALSNFSSCLSFLTLRTIATARVRQHSLIPCHSNGALSLLEIKVTTDNPDRKGHLHSSVTDTIGFHVSNSPLGVVEWDNEFRVCFWSGRAEELFGWKQDEVLGKHPDDWEFVHDDDKDSVAGIMDELLSGKAPRNISINRNFTRDGRVIHCEWYNSILTGEDGKLISVFSLIHDITDRIEAESQLRQLHKMESIGQLTGGISHDFNNLLTVILGNASLLYESLDKQPELKGLAETVLVAATRGAELTHKLLSFSRRQPLEPGCIDIGKLIDDIKPMLSRTLEESIALTLIPNSTWKAFADQAQLESAILNLCLNARDAMPGGGQMTIESQDVSLDADYAEAIGDIEPGEYVLIAISDTGIGIPADCIDQVFEPFFTTKEIGRGTGLGLAMVYGFVKQSNGHIKVYSEPGSGTTVRIYLPRFAGAETEQPRTLETDDSPVGQERILVVEDDELVRTYAVGQLERLGYQVEFAANGQEALELLKNDSSFDLLFTDVIMPGKINGPRLAALAREMDPDLKVLYTSGYTENAIIHHGRLDPGIILLSKPYRKSVLAQKVRQALQSD
jgi:PAS domain S-box-containing protein